MTLISQALLALAVAGTALATPMVAERNEMRPDCTHTVNTWQAYTYGPTSTVWTETATATQTVDCQGCESAQYSELYFGPGPVVMFTATVTAETASTTTVLACSKTAA
ncbi:hypothetical protein ISF_02365 [Cordyceps fumosorosea ARSEF 2679]|uniref:Uncharacterized protein n=1 Tax=Cordyceps fumosorosea (strain ARSEF 2679) TaxID=1081104 RepID=A0A168BPR0_CORFA|nr:hypothetical protein ISF_02365 [Cordyceps fumosorosea ARSEF 2679]OAA70391.1 hypothetical protein ISF_02365 [Cordyceps fumosorosea ARSEF 2679]